MKVLIFNYFNKLLFLIPLGMFQDHGAQFIQYLSHGGTRTEAGQLHDLIAVDGQVGNMYRGGRCQLGLNPAVQLE